jgi:hypothetical protein
VPDTSCPLLLSWRRASLTRNRRKLSYICRMWEATGTVWWNLGEIVSLSSRLPCSKQVCCAWVPPWLLPYSPLPRSYSGLLSREQQEEHTQSETSIRRRRTFKAWRGQPALLTSITLLGSPRTCAAIPVRQKFLGISWHLCPNSGWN